MSEETKTLSPIENFLLHHELDMQEGYGVSRKEREAIKYLKQFIEEKKLLVAHLKALNSRGCWIGENDSRKDAFDYVVELLEK